MTQLAPFEDSLAEGEVQIDDAQDDDVAPARHAASPPQPSEEEVERHRNLLPASTFIGSTPPFWATSGLSIGLAD